MADADAKPPPQSDPDADPIASAFPSSALDAAAIETQLAGLAVADDELFKPSGWDDDVPVPGLVDELSGDKLPPPSAPAPAVDSKPRFPRRPAEPDCNYYLKFGSCRFGMKCKYNHPARKKKNRGKASGSNGSGSNSSSNKASSPPDDDQTPKEEYEDLLPDISVEVDTLGFADKGSTSNSDNLKKTSCEVVDVKKGKVEPKEFKIAEETEKRSYFNKFNEKDQKVAKEKRKEIFSQNSAQEECKYYLTPGGCKFGQTCKYLHREGRERKSEAEKVDLNFLGLPIRPGGKECPYYMRTGSCKYATNCRFHHPDPSNVASKDSVLERENVDTHTPQQNVQGSSQPNVSVWPDQRGLNEQHAPYLPPPPSYSAGMIPPQGMYSPPEWSGYHQVPLNPYYPPVPGVPFQHFQAPPINHPMFKVADLPGNQQPPSDGYPERPGQPECQHFVRSGFCKFGMKCKYHHPRSPMPPPPTGALSPLGLPLKPDQPVCTYYGRYGVCKFGPSCMYNHPFNFGHPVQAVGPPLPGQYLTPGNYTV